jgi:hypothetical protein
MTLVPYTLNFCVIRREKMATQLNRNEVVSLREALDMEIIINQALIDLLVCKGIITQEEIMDKIEEIRKGLPKAL